jgi:DMSO/TMAO reductase YedYZ heme-binding membrane subunit
MGIGASLFLIAVGAILKWAVSVEVAGVDLEIVGLILLIVGILGLILSLLFWSSFSPYRRREETVVRDDRPTYRQ